MSKEETEWLDIILDGKMVSINEKGKIREKKHACLYCKRTEVSNCVWTSQGELICAACLIRRES